MPDEASESEHESASGTRKPFPVVGIGASAGGLDAFRQFFSEMPPDNGMAFVIVQHLDPTHKSMLVDLIDRYTRMRVFQVEDGIRIHPNCIYIIPPNNDMHIVKDTLYLTEPKAARGFRLPIDYFFRSLAETRREQAICVVLSGTGSDGSLGLRAIKGEGGLAIVQDPSSAKYNGMPHSAVATGLADLILEPEAMPEQLLNFVEQTSQSEGKKLPPLAASDAIQTILVTLRTETGHDFSQYKHNTIGRRIERRMIVNQIQDIQDYVRYVQNHKEEADILFRELLIGVTRFFRDKDAFEILEKKALPLIFEDRHLDEPIRVWVTGCATGEEAYSIAMLLREHMDESGIERNVQIFATDIDSTALARARQGIYPDNIVADVSPERLDRFFTKKEQNYQVVKDIRDMVVFAMQSVIRDPPFSRLDLISCRNVLIYVSTELQRKVLSLFNYALRPGGILFLGTSETLGEAAELFDVVNRRAKVFRRSTHNVFLGTRAFEFTPPPFNNPSSVTVRQDDSTNLRSVTERMLLDEYTPPSALVNEKNKIIYIHGQLGHYLDLPEGSVELNILRMATDNLRIQLAAALRRARQEGRDAVHRNIRTTIRDRARMVNITVRPVTHPAAMQGLYLVVFDEVDAPEDADGVGKETNASGDYQPRIVELEHELQSSRQYMQTLVEELETTNEELKSTNEELQSSNEELQSTNEELETAKEELQSVNEELVTVNAELHAKIDELSHSNNDLNNLFSTLDVGIIFVDLALRIRQFNAEASQLVNLIDSDVGRPLHHIVANMAYTDLVKDAQEVLDKLVPFETEVQTTAGKWYWMRIRPYRTLNNAIEGVVLTFSEITEQKRIQEELRVLTRAVNQSASIVIVCDKEWRIDYVNPSFVELTGYILNDVMSKHLSDLGLRVVNDDLQNGPWESVESGEDWIGELQITKKDGTPLWTHVAISPVLNDERQIIQFIVIADDITERKSLEERLAEADLYRMLARNLRGFTVLLYDHDLRYLKVEGTALTVSGYDPSNMEGRTLLEVAPDVNLDKLEKVYRRALSGETVDFEITSARTGQNFAGRAIPVRDENGDIIAGMLLSWQVDGD